ncbi:hypothetical protein [Faecalibacter sp. LW9]|uniref:hypothetical protein n=1 Tax=Faecalibacter sp. LW9 TaxID=3103144 RepID=UPI002AFFE193|nr:hypothetical protein [Faecalibacter sp. LW9]
MQSHKSIKKILDQFLPHNYKRVICDKLGMDYSPKNEQRIYRVRVGVTNDLKIMEALVDLAVNQKKHQTKILKKVK